MKSLTYRLFWADFQRQRKRFVLTTLALAWGTLTIVILLAFGHGLMNQFQKSQQGIGESIVLIYGSQTSLPYHGLPKGRDIRLTEDDVTFMKEKIPEIDLICPLAAKGNNVLSYNKKTVNITLSGVYPCYGELRNHYPEKGGRFINDLDITYCHRVVFLGDELKKDLFGDEEAVGKTISINSIPFMVIGIMKKKLQSRFAEVPDAKVARIPFSTYKVLFQKGEYISTIIYRPNDINHAEKIKKAVYTLLGSKHKFDSKDKNALWFWDVLENQRTMGKILLGLKLFLIIIGAMSLIAGGVGVANISFATVKQRTKEIGIKIALGAQRKTIMMQFLGESLIISLWGGCVGMAMAFTFIYLFLQIPLQGEAADYFAHPVISLEIILLTVLILSLIGIAAGFFPARRATKLNPIEALRYE
ncbi:MAG: ABC transporter permease [Planctomycetota bacterium]